MNKKKFGLIMIIIGLVITLYFFYQLSQHSKSFKGKFLKAHSKLITDKDKEKYIMYGIGGIAITGIGIVLYLPSKKRKRRK